MKSSDPSKEVIFSDQAAFVLYGITLLHVCGKIIWNFFTTSQGKGTVYGTQIEQKYYQRTNAKEVNNGQNFQWNNESTINHKISGVGK